MLRPVRMFDRDVEVQIWKAELCVESFVRGHHVFKRTWGIFVVLAAPRGILFQRTLHFCGSFFRLVCLKERGLS